MNDFSAPPKYERIVTVEMLAHSQLGIAMVVALAELLHGIAKLWGYAGGKEWIVSHYRLRKP